MPCSRPVGTLQKWSQISLLHPHHLQCLLQCSFPLTLGLAMQLALANEIMANVMLAKAWKVLARTIRFAFFLILTSAIAMNTCLGWPNGSRETCGAELNQPSCLSWDSPRSLNGQPKPSHVSEPSYHHQNHLTIPEAWAINAYYRIPLRFCWLFVSQHYCGNIEYIESVYRKTQVSGIGQA